ncbi:protein-L-isoaspartate(D-aspartate) O-methyltransferase [Piscinibacter koreensis]|uniref:Protein-L-isoaspartate O-methyltransferase n=1 Tax=Piscinibacter koreensis TaxID=2742824 RepID=A0A7Y6NKH8_9BURK|nr:protein-L-isoaspartate(D-aspartate) O-methyltransferase [Schlegelella koreensis]NUZ04861.1 protein-L-isoaspartate(D-aspartate) O-methyltransferase [Schlegelella koreensis]
MKHSFDSREAAAARAAMVEEQLVARGIADPRVLDAMRQLPREAFLSAATSAAYADSAQPIEAGQTISQPYIVALMAEAARIGPADRVLEVGAGSGYAAAVCAALAAEVYAIERHPQLVEIARARLERLGIANVHLQAGDGTLGWPDAAPFDAILVSAAGPRVPESLRSQLAEEGRLVMPVGRRHATQQLVRVTRGANGFVEEHFAAVAFVPLIGAEGFESS